MHKRNTLRMALFAFCLILLSSFAYADIIVEQMIGDSDQTTWGQSGGTKEGAQCFRLNDTMVVQSVAFRLNADAIGTGGNAPYEVVIQNSTVSGKPNGINISDVLYFLTADLNHDGWNNGTFTTQPTLEANELYCIAFLTDSTSGRELFDYEPSADYFAQGSFLTRNNGGNWNNVSGGTDTAFQLNGSAPSGDTSIPTFVIPTPANNTVNNTQITINWTCADGTNYLWFNDTKVVDNSSSTSEYTTNVSASATVEYSAACYNASLSGFSTNVTRVWTYDVVYPVIVINGNNAFDQNNFSQVSQYLDTFFFNLTFTDNNDLFAYSINVTKNVVTILYNETNESISGTEFNYTNTLNTTNWTDGWYDIEIQVSDSHTADEIQPYGLTKANKKLTYETAEGNNIEISTDDDAVTNSKKYKDRYDFSFDFTDDQRKARTFHVKSDHKIVYRADSNYKAHFIVFNDFGGNWIDFEGVGGDPNIIKISDYHYKVMFIDLPSSVKFNSIGGLNTYVANHRWYKGTATKIADSAGVNETTYINLSLTRDPSHDNFSAFLVYNGTTYASPNKTDDGSDVVWNQTLTSSITEGEIPYHWNVTYNQTDGTIINFLINGSQTVFDWGVFNCSTGNVSLILNIFDENYPDTARIATVDLEILTWISDPDNYHTFEGKLEGASSYNICLYPVNETLRMDFYAQYTTATGFTHRYYIYNGSITNTSQNISMYNTNTTTGYSELVITARKTANYRYFDNVVAKFQRRYVDEGVWRTIQMDQSGDFGTIIFHLLEQNTDYKILYYDIENNLLKETETLKFSCTASKCELTQLLDEAAAVAVGENISVSSSLDNSTYILTVTWVDPEANNNKVEVKVSKQTLTGELVICDTFQTGASGIVTCNVSGYTGDIFLTVLTSNSPYTPILSEWIALARTGLFSQMTPDESAFWTLAIMITVVGFGLWSAAAALIATIIGLIVVFFLGIFQPITITFIIIASALSIAVGLKLRK